MKIAVVGAQGRMGQSVCAAVADAQDMELVAQLDAGDDITEETLAGAEVAIEFTVPSATDDNVHALLDAGVHVVVGTTGWTAERLEKVAQHCDRVQRNAIIAPNFSLSAVLAMTFARQAAQFFESAEVVEMHHPNKVDAPSGTAVSTAQMIAQARQEAGRGVSPDATQTDPDGARGANVDGVHVHAVRLRGLNAHEEILFGNPGEQLVIRQDSFDRSSFMPGILMAARAVPSRPGLTHGLESILGLTD